VIEKIHKAEKAKHAVHIAPELASITHLVSSPFKLVPKSEKNPWEISSIAELTVKKMLKTQPDALIEYNAHALTRTYPKGTRFDSSNFSPMESWAIGSQTVALNYQTADFPMFLNSGRFLDNGGCGLLLKPPRLLKVDEKNVDTSISLTWKFISGWQLPKVSGTTKGEVIDPYLKVKLFGAPGDTGRFKTKTIQNNGFNPKWDETVNFKISKSDLAMVLVELFDEDKLSKDDFIAYAAFPVESLNPGYRSLSLYNSKFKIIENSSLLLQVTIEK